MGNRIAERWQEKKQKVLSRFGGCCAYCGHALSLKEMQMDHFISKSDYRNKKREMPEGFCVDNISNLFPACASCNNYKRANSVEMFRDELGKQIHRLRRNVPTFRLAERYGMIKCSEVNVVFHFEKYKG